MANKKQEQTDDKNKRDNAVARVSGAVQVAGRAVSETMAIRIEALDDVRSTKTKSNANAEKKAIKKIKKVTKKVSEKSK